MEEEAFLNEWLATPMFLLVVDKGVFRICYRAFPFRHPSHGKPSTESP